MEYHFVFFLKIFLNKSQNEKKMYLFRKFYTLFMCYLQKTNKILFEIDCFCKSCVVRVIWNTENIIYTNINEFKIVCIIVIFNHILWCAFVKTMANFRVS
jgi:hypothetical protein